MSVRIKLLALVSVLAIVAAACGSESEDGTPSAGGDTGSSVDVVSAIGDTEGELNLIAWPGYTEKGWVKPFEDETGCKVSVKYGNTSDDMVNLIRNKPGQYDGVSASGDATNRLIASGNVSAIDPALFPELSDVIAALQPGVRFEHRPLRRGRQRVRRAVHVRAELPDVQHRRGLAGA